jgi:hypothetical protein
MRVRPCVPRVDSSLTPSLHRMHTLFMLSNTAAATVTFSDDWDAEEPTQVEQAPVHLAPIPDWQDRTGTWAAIDDADLRRVFALGDDPTSTLRDLPAVRS